MRRYMERETPGGESGSGCNWRWGSARVNRIRYPGGPRRKRWGARCWSFLPIQCAAANALPAWGVRDRKVETQRNWRPGTSGGGGFDPKQREEPTGVLTSRMLFRDVTSVHRWQVVHGCRQLVSGDVGLPGNERNPYVSFRHHSVGHPKRDCRYNRRKVDDVNHAALMTGATRATSVGTTSCESWRRRATPATSPDCGRNSPTWSRNRW